MKSEAFLHSPISEDDLAQLEAYAHAASAPPWYVPKADDDDAFLVLAGDPQIADAAAIAHTRWPLTMLSPSPGKAVNNARFIALTRNLALPMLAEIRRLRRENELLRDVANRAQRYLGRSDSNESLLALNLSHALDEWTDRGNP